jgi:hypothetical protein
MKFFLLVVAWFVGAAQAQEGACETACQKATTECVLKGPTDPQVIAACTTEAMKCTFKCQGIPEEMVTKIMECAAACPDDAEKTQCTSACAQKVLTPDCFKGPDGTPKDSPLAKCFSSSGISFDTEGDPEIKTCANLDAAKKCATDNCGGKIPIIFQPMVKEFATELSCGGGTAPVNPSPTPKPTEIPRTGSPSAVGGTGAPTAAFTRSPTPKKAEAPTPQPKKDDPSGASSLLPTVAVALGAVVVLA